MFEVRIAESRDAAAIAAIYRPYVEETAISFEEAAPDAAAIAKRMAALSKTHPFLVGAEAAEVLGYAYASPHRERAAYRWSVDVTVYVGRDGHRRGLGRALYGELLGILRAQGFHAAFAGITLPNAASVGLHEAMGFTRTATYAEVGFKLGAWRDVGWWRLGLNSARGAPEEPILFACLTASRS
ncbi:MAG: arsinothricin resistance N-acetyltransferase ArsN1 family B [Caulobacteraceae bacterium]